MGRRRRKQDKGKSYEETMYGQKCVGRSYRTVNGTHRDMNLTFTSPVLSAACGPTIMLPRCADSAWRNRSHRESHHKST